MTDKDKHNSGWNDPPLFSYNEHQTVGKGINLNRRISYPLSSIPSQRKSSTSESCTGSPVTPPVIGPPETNSLNIRRDSQEFEEEVTTRSTFQPVELCNVIDNFMTTLREVFPNEQEKEAAEIIRRLNLMETMWKGNTFPEEVQQKLLLISEEGQYQYQ